MVKLIALTLALALLGGCVNYTDRVSPCVCDWAPVNGAAPDERALG